MNHITLIGNLGKDPETRYNSDQKAMCRFAIAVNEGWGDKKQTMWINIVSFGKTAENCGKYLAKGKKVAVEGRLQVRKYKKQDGTEGTSVDVVANEVEFIGGQEKEAPQGFVGLDEAPPF